jgi:hypothetical protein
VPSVRDDSVHLFQLPSPLNGMGTEYDDDDEDDDDNLFFFDMVVAVVIDVAICCSPLMIVVALLDNCRIVDKT